MKICFLIPDGIGIRNYLYSSIIPLIQENGEELAIWHSLDAEVLEEVNKLHSELSVESFKFNFYKEAPFPRFLRDCIGYARLAVNAQLVNNDTVLDNWLPKRNIKGKISNALAKLLGSTFSNLEKIQAVETIVSAQYRKSGAYQKYAEDLKRIKPDLLFCTHQREPNAGIAMLAARDMGIITIASIFSWDNLPKGRLPMRANHFLVWSDYMKQEMKLYFPDIEQDSIHIVGTPQFDFYSNQELIQSRVDFAKEFGLDESKNWICFSGDDSLTSPHDPLYLKDIAEKLKDCKDIQVLFRPVPVEGIERYQQVLDKYPQVKFMKPSWKKGSSWNKFFPYPKDISILVNLARHCATVLNVGSTMALDFSQFDKPGLYLNYDIVPNHPWSIKRVYKFQHFKTLEGITAVGWINDPEEILPKVLEAIHEPSKIAPDRIQWRKRISYQEENNSASLRIANFLNSLNPSSA